MEIVKLETKETKNWKKKYLDVAGKLKSTMTSLSKYYVEYPETIERLHKSIQSLNKEIASTKASSNITEEDYKKLAQKRQRQMNKILAEWNRLQAELHPEKPIVVKQEITPSPALDLYS
jgi:peptidoglycan hydrolase CwlO-like protein